MNNAKQIEQILRELFASQNLAVLSTHRSGQPHASLVAFVAADDLREILFATPRTTRKYSNLLVDPRAAILVDNRSNRESDARVATAVTAKGSVAEIQAEYRETYLTMYLGRHPQLVDFVKSPSCALMVLRVETYSVVRRFQNVMELHVAS